MLTKSMMIINKKLMSCKNYKPYGEFIVWHSNGNTRYKPIYEDGKKHGKFIGWLWMMAT